MAQTILVGDTLQDELLAAGVHYPMSLIEKIITVLRAHDSTKQVVPVSVKRTSVRAVLADDGTKLDTLDAAIDASRSLKELLSDSPYLRDSKAAREIKRVLGLTNKQTDDLFIAAREIEK